MREIEGDDLNGPIFCKNFGTVCDVRISLMHIYTGNSLIWKQNILYAESK
jgi:hypothetical protein